MQSRALVCAAIVVSIFAVGPAWSRAVPERNPTEDLIRREETRAAVQAALETLYMPVDSGDERIDNVIRAVESLRPFGKDAVPFLANELDQELPESFDFCVYALGLIQSPESESALRRAFSRADEQTGTFARNRKAMSAWALSFHGAADVIDELDTGKHLTANFPIHHRMSLIEAAAFQIGEKSVPLLLAQLERYAADEKLEQRRYWTIAALRRVGDPSAVAGLVRLFDDPEPDIRREAAIALRTMGTPEAVSALFNALEDPGDVTVRRAAALSLERIRPEGHLEAIKARLEIENDPLARGGLYRLLAKTSGARALPVLRAHRDRAEPDDRRYWAQALGFVGNRKSVELLHGALSDPDNSVAVHAALSLGRIGDRHAIGALTRGVGRSNRVVLQTIVDELRRLEVQRSAPAIRDRLLQQELRGVLQDRRDRVAIEKICRALVEFEDLESLPGLRAALARQTEPGVTDILRQAVHDLELIEGDARESSRWVDLARDPDARLRLLAYAQLARSGGETAADALLEAFERSPNSERTEIVRALGRIASPSSVGLIKRVLLDPEFDAVDALPVRDMAAWSARRLGGEGMFETLAAAVERRGAREIKPLLYAALLNGPRTADLIRAHRISRMKYLGWHKGIEQEKLDEVTDDIVAGRALVEIDLSPDRLHVR